MTSVACLVQEMKRGTTESTAVVGSNSLWSPSFRATARANSPIRCDRSPGLNFLCLAACPALRQLASLAAALLPPPSSSPSTIDRSCPASSSPCPRPSPSSTPTHVHRWGQRRRLKAVSFARPPPRSPCCLFLVRCALDSLSFPRSHPAPSPSRASPPSKIHPRPPNPHPSSYHPLPAPTPLSNFPSSPKAPIPIPRRAC